MEDTRAHGVAWISFRLAEPATRVQIPLGPLSFPSSFRLLRFAPGASPRAQRIVPPRGQTLTLAEADSIRYGAQAGLLLRRLPGSPPARGAGPWLMQVR